MEFVGNPTRILMPYDEEAEEALTRVHLIQNGVPERLFGPAAIEAEA